ncbi:MAG TPA: hypothetical protein VLW26_01235 [Steroidobacteraceae bacterium]|nr:hypothetical protein [Steroidobacteraceae bacterium]
MARPSNRQSHARSALVAALCCLAGLAGCVVHETKPLPRVNAVQAQQQIPADELLDVAVHVFEPGIPPEIAKDEQALAKKRIYPQIREAESHYLPTMLRATLESCGQWGSVRVVPATVEFVDVSVTGKILESTGAQLALEISVSDSTARVWISHKRYQSGADTGSYKTDAALKARDPFQNVYSQIANDMVAARDRLLAQNRRDIRRVTELRFAHDLAPQAMDGYLAHTQHGKDTTFQVVRLPAAEDPVASRISRIRESDSRVVDTVDGYYSNFADQMREPYGEWRRSSFDDIEKQDKLQSQANTRTVLGAAAILASVLVPGHCDPYNYTCRYVEEGLRTAGVVGGTASVLSGIKKYSDARIQGQALKELSQSFQSEVAPQVVDVEGQSLKLTGTAEEQYREWRQMLQQLYLTDSAAAPAAPPPPVANPNGPAS